MYIYNYYSSIGIIIYIIHIYIIICTYIFVQCIYIYDTGTSKGLPITAP